MVSHHGDVMWLNRTCASDKIKKHYYLHNVIKAITNLGLLIQFDADNLIDHGDVIDYKLLPIEFYIAYDVIKL